jgi:hypothetical protein
VVAAILPVSVPLWRAVSSSRLSSGRTFSLVASAAWPAVDSKSSSSRFIGEARQRLVHPAKRFRQRLAKIRLAFLGAHRHPAGDRLHDVAHAMAIEAAALQGEQRHVVNPGANVDACANRLARSLPDLFAGQRRIAAGRVEGGFGGVDGHGSPFRGIRVQSRS